MDYKIKYLKYKKKYLYLKNSMYGGSNLNENIRIAFEESKEDSIVDLPENLNCRLKKSDPYDIYLCNNNRLDKKLINAIETIKEESTLVNQIFFYNEINISDNFSLESSLNGITLILKLCIYLFIKGIINIDNIPGKLIKDEDIYQTDFINLFYASFYLNKSKIKFLNKELKNYNFLYYKSNDIRLFNNKLNIKLFNTYIFLIILFVINLSIFIQDILNRTKNKKDSSDSLKNIKSIILSLAVGINNNNLNSFLKFLLYFEYISKLQFLIKILKNKIWSIRDKIETSLVVKEGIILTYSFDEDHAFGENSSYITDETIKLIKYYFENKSTITTIFKEKINKYYKEYFYYKNIYLENIQIEFDTDIKIEDLFLRYKFNNELLNEFNHLNREKILSKPINFKQVLKDSIENLSIKELQTLHNTDNVGIDESKPHKLPEPPPEPPEPPKPPESPDIFLSLFNYYDEYNKSFQSNFNTYFEYLEMFYDNKYQIYNKKIKKLQDIKKQIINIFIKEKIEAERQAE